MKASDFPQTINGIFFQTKQEYDQRVESDLEQLAQFLYKLYRDKKVIESTDRS